MRTMSGRFAYLAALIAEVRRAKKVRGIWTWSEDTERWRAGPRAAIASVSVTLDVSVT